MGPDGERLRDRYRGAMLGTLVGDAFGARFEGRRVVSRADVDRWLAATDTIAAMAGGLAGAYLGEQGIPPALLARTEAAEEVRDLADQLFARVAPT